MTSTVLQVRMDDSLRAAAADIAEQLGLDLPTVIRMFLKKMVAERGVPFSLSLPREPQPSTQRWRRCRNWADRQSVRALPI